MVEQWYAALKAATLTLGLETLGVANLMIGNGYPIGNIRCRSVRRRARMIIKSSRFPLES